MRLSIIITFAIIYLVASDDPTYTYKCADDLELDTCYLKKATDTEITYYLKACKKGKKCSKKPNNSGVGYCYKEIELLEEGDKCVLDEECKTQKCSQNKCAYLADGDECNGNNQCGIKSKCDDYYSGKCVAYVGEGASCEVVDGVERPCRPGLVCGKIDDAEDEKCIKQFSVENGKKVSSSVLCKSGTIDDDDDNKCIDPTEDKSEWDAYVEEYIDEQEDVLKEDKEKLSDIDRYTLNSKSVAEKRVEYLYKKAIGTGDDADCIKDFYIQDILSSYSLRFSFVSLLLLFVSLF